MKSFCDTSVFMEVRKFVWKLWKYLNCIFHDYRKTKDHEIGDEKLYGQLWYHNLYVFFTPHWKKLILFNFTLFFIKYNVIERNPMRTGTPCSVGGTGSNWTYIGFQHWRLRLSSRRASSGTKTSSRRFGRGRCIDTLVPHLYSLQIWLCC